MRNPPWIRDFGLFKKGVWERRPCHHVDSPERIGAGHVPLEGNQGVEQDIHRSEDLSQASVSPGRCKDRALTQPANSSVMFRSCLQKPHRCHFSRTTMASAADYVGRVSNKTWYGRIPSAAVDWMVSRTFLAWMWEMNRAFSNRVFRGISGFLDHIKGERTLRYWLPTFKEVSKGEINQQIRNATLFYLRFVKQFIPFIYTNPEFHT